MLRKVNPGIARSLSEPIELSSWWTLPMTRAEFDRKAAEQAERMSHITPGGRQERVPLNYWPKHSWIQD